MTTSASACGDIKSCSAAPCSAHQTASALAGQQTSLLSNAHPPRVHSAQVTQLEPALAQAGCKQNRHGGSPKNEAITRECANAPSGKLHLDKRIKQFVKSQSANRQITMNTTLPLHKICPCEYLSTIRFVRPACRLPSIRPTTSLRRLEGLWPACPTESSACTFVGRRSHWPDAKSSTHAIAASKPCSASAPVDPRAGHL